MRSALRIYANKATHALQQRPGVFFGMPILAQITSDDVLDSAYEWLCRQRRDYSANLDV